MKQLFKIKSTQLQSYWIFGILLFGLLVRIRQYIYNRSLWYDEAALAVNIVDRDYSELLDVLDNNQAAAPLFLWIEKLAIEILGNNEYALRLFPFISGIIALWLFYLLAKRFTSGITTIVAVALFATLKEVVYYTAEVKQYSSDLTIGLILFLLLATVRSRILNLKQITGLSILGGISIWLSHPAIFIMAGVEITNAIGNSWQKIKSLIINRLPLYIFWLINFISLYVLTIKKTMSNEHLVASWGARYPSSIFDIVWLLDAFGRFFHRPMGFIGIGDGIGLVAFVVGAVYLYKTARFKLLLLNAPLLITLVAAYLHKYPFRDRLIFFLAPYAMLIIAEAITFLIKYCDRQYQLYKQAEKNKSLFKISLIFIFTNIIIISCLFVPIVRAGVLLVNPRILTIEHLSAGVKYIKANQKPDDIIYVFPTTHVHFKYYASKYNLDTKNHIYLADNPLEDSAGYQESLAKLENKGRVWFILYTSRVREEDLARFKKTLVQDLDEMARKIDAIEDKDYYICLYDFSNFN